MITMKKFLYFSAAAAALVLLGAGCSPMSVPATNVNNANSSSALNAPIKTTSLDYLVSSGDVLKYCNGADMDTDGYRKTITVKKTLVVPKADLTPNEIVQQTIQAAAGEQCQQILSNGPITVDHGIVTIPQVGGWAGVSISMCGCQPLIEVNALQIPGVTKVFWQ
jgi:hypothetical protein